MQPCVQRGECVQRVCPVCVQSLSSVLPACLCGLIPGEQPWDGGLSLPHCPLDLPREARIGGQGEGVAVKKWKVDVEDVVDVNG